MVVPYATNLGVTSGRLKGCPDPLLVWVTSKEPPKKAMIFLSAQQFTYGVVSEAAFAEMFFCSRNSVDMLRKFAEIRFIASGKRAEIWRMISDKFLQCPKRPHKRISDLPESHFLFGGCDLLSWGFCPWDFGKFFLGGGVGQFAADLCEIVVCIVVLSMFVSCCLIAKHRFGSVVLVSAGVFRMHGLPCSACFSIDKAK